MAQRVNVSAMHDDVLRMFSDYNHADLQLELIGERFKAEKSEWEALRDEALEAGDDVAVASYVHQIKELEARTAEEKKPYMNARKEAMKLFPANLHDAYVIATVKGDFNAVGSVEVSSVKNGKTIVTKYEVSKDSSFRNCMRDFLEKCGMYSPTDKTTDKHAQAMLIACGGMVKANYTRTGKRATVKSERQFSELVVRVYIDTFMVNNNAFMFADDGTITRNVF